MNKKILPIVVSVVVILVVIIGCVVWYKVATTPAKNLDNGEKVIENVVNNEKQKEEETISNEPIFTLDNYPKVDASLAIHPLVDSIASNFLGIDESKLDFEYTKTRSSEVYHNLIDGKVDVIFAAEISKEDEAYAKQKNVDLQIIPATSSAFVFVVNKDNPVNSLTLEQVQDIYQGKITNWKEVGGDDAEIIPYQRPVGSGSQTAMVSLVMKGKKMVEPQAYQIESEMEGLINAIAEYDNSKYALGYSYFYYVNTMYKRDTIKMIAIDGVEPTIETIKNGKYPIYTNGFIVYNKAVGEDSNTIKWVNSVLSTRGSKIIEDAGYVPVSDGNTNLNHIINERADTRTEHSDSLLLKSTDDSSKQTINSSSSSNLEKLKAAYTNNFFDVADFLEDADDEWIKYNDNGDYFGYEEWYWPGCSSWCGANYICTANASSTLEPQGKFSYEADNITNGKRTNTWVEGVKGYGIGEYVELKQQFEKSGADKIDFKEICIVNGYAENLTKWKNNSRVKELKVFFNDKYITTLELEDNIKPQYFDISSFNLSAKMGEETKFKFEIADVYKGEKYDDTAITGITVEFTRPFGH